MTVCKRCVMDSTDPEIIFNDQGICNHCIKAESFKEGNWFPNEVGKKKLEKMAAEIKKATKGQEYNAIIGLSGGVDSSYLAYVATKIMKLKVLAVHVDGGWNSDEAVSNIQNLTNKLNIDLHTVVINWQEMKDLQLAFFKASVANQDTPQDHAFFAGLYDFATKFGIKYVLSGGNFATESILPPAWGYDAMDSRQLKDIHNKFGNKKLKSFPTVGFFKYHLYYPKILGMKVVRPLNLMPYDKNEAIDFMTKNLGWKYYGGKHYESVFTKFFQSYYLPTKFGYDKRKAHFSSMIVSGQMSRDEALKELKKPSYDKKTIKNDIEYVAKKLDITVVEFENLIKSPNKTFHDYKSNYALRNFIKSVLGFLSKIKKTLKNDNHN